MIKYIVKDKYVLVRGSFFPWNILFLNILE